MTPTAAPAAPPVPAAPPGPDRRARLGMALAPLLFAWCLWGPMPDGLTDPMRAAAAVTLAMAALWICEPVSLAVTALLPLVLFPLLGVAKAPAVASAYANDLVFLMLGGFVLANGLEAWGLQHRLGRAILALAGPSPRRLVGGLMAATAFLSLWISNTAAALLMMPVALSVLAMAPASDRRFRSVMVLGVAAAASIGGIGTPVGSTPNLLLLSTARQLYGLEIDFGTWMLLGLPVVVVFTALAWGLAMALFPPEARRLEGTGALPPAGAWRAGEVVTAAVFVATALAWVFRAVGLNAIWPHLTDGGIALAGAIALFVLPVGWRPMRFALDWERGGRLPWDILILLGGGLALAEGIRATGLDGWLVAAMGGLEAWPPVLGLVAVAVVCVFFSEIASNTATTALLLPIAGTLAAAWGQHPLYLMLPVTLASSLGFMLPVATPPNALAIGSGQTTAPEMARLGVLLNVAGIALVLGACYAIGFSAFGAR